MANSGIMIVDFLFNLAVRYLYALAEFFGITYEEINVWIFVVSWPLSLIVAALWITYLLYKVKRLQRSSMVHDRDNRC
jgi:hypothetical protein